MRARRARDHGDLSDAETADAVPEHDASGPEPTSGGLLDRAEPTERQGPVRVVEKSGHRSAGARIRSYSTGEYRDAAQPAALERSQRVGHREGSVGETDRHGHPPP